MVQYGLSEDDWQTLEFSITQGRCILMLGPDAVVEDVAGESVPVMQQFSRMLAAKLSPESVGQDVGNLAHVAQVYERITGRTDLEAQAKKFFEGRRAKHSKVLSDLAAVPFKLIVDTTPICDIDTNICSQVGKSYISDWYHFEGPAKSPPMGGTPETPLVYHLYGCIKNTASLVLSENDLLRFLVAVISKNPDLPPDIRSKLKDITNCFLFLGFGFKHWYLRILLHVLYDTGRTSRSFALETFDAAMEGKNVERTKLFFQEGHRIRFFDADLQQFAGELRRRCSPSSASEPKAANSEVSPDAASIFLCHTNEDKAIATDLYDKLKKKGFRPWVDKEELRGGDQWNPKIQKVIREIDYFVVLVSKALLQRNIGYVNKEITAALDRSTEFRPPLIFIIPAIIEKECALLDQLKGLHAVDLTKDGGEDALMKNVIRDLERRRKGG
jgi:TIR domain/SIR2-like domain